MSLQDRFSFLHDASMLEFKYSADTGGARGLIVKLKCSPDTGHTSWDNKSVCVRASGVLVLKFIGWGFTSGEESFDGWHETLSSETAEEIRELVSNGVQLPEYMGTMTFHSGSKLEIACATLEVTFDD